MKAYLSRIDVESNQRIMNIHMKNKKTREARKLCVFSIVMSARVQVTCSYLYLSRYLEKRKKKFDEKHKKASLPDESDQKGTEASLSSMGG